MLIWVSTDLPSGPRTSGRLEQAIRSHARQATPSSHLSRIPVVWAASCESGNSDCASFERDRKPLPRFAKKGAYLGDEHMTQCGTVHKCSPGSVFVPSNALKLRQIGLTFERTQDERVSGTFERLILLHCD
jgi:hypothetical protein